MSSITSRLSGSAGMLLFPLYFMYRKRKKAFLLLIVAFALTVSSCYQHYFKTHTQQKADTDMLQKLQSANKYFIVHFKTGVAGLTNLSIKNNTIEADIVTLGEDHLKYLNPETSRTNRVKKNDKNAALMEVHLYTNEEKKDNGRLSLPLSSVNRVDVYEFDKSATNANHIISTVGVVIASVAVVTLIAVAIACNCPQIYVNNNGQYQFNGGMYSGAVYSSLERTDYMPLGSLQPTDNMLNLKIGNAPNEEQFINSVQLLKVDHPVGSKVMVDRHGNIFSYKDPQLPISVLAGTDDVKEILRQTDQNYYSFNNNQGKKDFSNVILSFKKPANAAKAKLLIHGKNSDWSGYIYKEFNSLFGEGMSQWKKQEDKADPKVMEQWQKDQAMPVMVYVQNGNNWNYADYFAMTGNTASRDLVMELDLSNIKEETINIKLETVYRFWDLDYAAIDFSDNEIQSSSYMDPVKASLADATDEKNNLLLKDRQYCHLTGADAINLQFGPAVVHDKISSTWFLVSSGYYHSLEEYEGKPKLMELMKFKNKGTFNAFSKSKYQHVNDELEKYAVKN
ncbi:MAG: hypothetical protein ABJA78_01860 [Ferruginibacter sp.]